MADTPMEAIDNFVDVFGCFPKDQARDLLTRLFDERLAAAQQDTARLEAQIGAATAMERNDCEKALLALSGAGYPTPQEGYGSNSSWAISDLCRCVAAMSDQKEQQK